MLKKPVHQARKAPRQPRAKVTMDAMLTATTRLLTRDGYDALTTNAVAELAGVSIGTLYQYFPDKAALVGGVFDREIQQKLDALELCILEHKDAPLPLLVRSMISALHVRNPPGDMLRRALIALQVRFAAEGLLVESAEPFLALVQRVIEERPHEIRTQNPRLLAFMVVHTMEALLHSAVLQPPGALDPKAVVDELTRMMVGYLASGDVVKPTERTGRSRKIAAPA